MASLKGGGHVHNCTIVLSSDCEDDFGPLSSYVISLHTCENSENSHGDTQNHPYSLRRVYLDMATSREYSRNFRRRPLIVLGRLKCKMLEPPLLATTFKTCTMTI